METPEITALRAENKRLREALQMVLAHLPARAIKIRAVIQNALGIADPKRKVG